MQQGFTRFSLICFLSLPLLLQSCKKESTVGIDNDKIIETPYTLLIGNDQGQLMKTNDAVQYQNVFPPDGYPMNAIVAYGDNLLFVKSNLHLSENNGENFNPVFLTVKHFPWREMILSAPQQNRIYITSTTGNGVSYSEDGGETWQDDNAFDEPLPQNFEISSFATTDDGNVYALSYKNFTLFKRSGQGGNWSVVTMNGFFPPVDAKYYITASGNNLYAVDYSGVYDQWHSEDGGQTWEPYHRGTVMPYKHHNNDAAAATDGPLLVGTDSFGVFRSEGDEMVPSSDGLESYTTVYSIVVKKNIYKNGVTNEYVFLATNNGLYRSQDKGYTWDKVTSGIYDQKYTAMY